VKELSLFDDRRMSVLEVANALGVTAEAIKKHVRILFPDLLRNGIVTMLDEAQVVEIKKHMMPTTMVAGASTDLEMEQKTFEVLAWMKSKIESQQRTIAIMAPKAEAHDALMKTDTDMSITQAAKHFGLHPKTQVFPYLRDHGYLTSIDLPTQRSIDLDIMSVRQSHPDKWGKTHSQAVVKARQLDRFRKIIAEKFAGSGVV
jgi:phage antirepressor YoqD-like protein